MTPTSPNITIYINSWHCLSASPRCGHVVASNIRLYAERLRHNMAFEELVLFPAASRSLTDDDWRAMELSAQRDPSDPLFQGKVQERFVELHRAISAEAGCGCDDRDH